MNRRHFVRQATLASILGTAVPAWAVEVDPPSQTEAEAMRALVLAFLQEHGIQGMAIAYGREGRVAFEAGYGFADAAGKEAVTAESLFRIASISKPITATAVIVGVEKGLLRLDARVFGPDGILGEAYGRNLPAPVRAITVDHFLTHSSGGWANDKSDPMFRDPKIPQHELIRWALANQKQTHRAGEHYAYSNFGYCVLGRVLEKAGQQPYEAFVQQQVLAKCGITDMRIAGNTLAERLPREVMYVTGQPEAAYKMNVPRMDSHGGWLATAGALVRFASQLPKVLDETSLRTMTTHGVSDGYARGWSVNKVPNWWHGGSLPGTSTIMVHTARGLCWAGLLNGRTEGLGPALDRLMWQLGRQVKSWRV